ncbi:hypothetical protein [Streptomyces sp. Y1]|uniref:Uncharacterized protein n=1 Tax=Streptomyces sp. Y1 TaxID=3238634 RepID=A0AB39TVA2_9ACTN
MRDGVDQLAGVVADQLFGDGLAGRRRGETVAGAAGSEDGRAVRGERPSPAGTGGRPRWRGRIRAVGLLQWPRRTFIRARSALISLAPSTGPAPIPGTASSYDASAVSHWHGGTSPAAKVLPVVLETLTRRLKRPVTAYEAGFSDEPGAVDQQTDTVPGLIDLGSADMDPSRRGVLTASPYSVALSIPGRPDLVGRFKTLRTNPHLRIGMAEVQSVAAMTEKISELDDQFGGRMARPMAASFLVNSIAPYLQADAPEKVRKAMLSAAADHNAASAASPEAGPRMRAFPAGQQAHAAAQTGDRAGALYHLRIAETAVEQAESKAKASAHTTRSRWRITRRRSAGSSATRPAPSPRWSPPTGCGTRSTCATGSG